jgi:bifunctional DNase/RNase
MVEMHVAAISVDPGSGGAVLLLQDEAERSLSICIGLPEATAIAKELEGLKLPRPLTHDLLRAVIEHLGARLVRVEIMDLREGTYYAELVLAREGQEETRVDSRPSDAIALAVRAGAPLWVHEHVLRQSDPDPKTGPLPVEKEDWVKLLEQMDPKDFGKYKM